MFAKSAGHSRWWTGLEAILLLLAVVGAAEERALARSLPVGPVDSSARPGLDIALAGATAGDTLLLAPGLYPGTHVLKSGVSLIGAEGPESTTLDAAGERYVLQCRGVGDGTTIAGLTLRNGRRDHPNSGGGGIYLYRSSPAILNCVFTGNLGYLGPGVYASLGSSPIVAYCVFHDNEGYLGGAIAAYGDCEPLVFNNVIYDNTAVSGGAILAQNSIPVIVMNTIVANVASEAGGGAIYLNASSALVEANVVAFNGGSGAVFCLDDSRHPSISENLFWKNTGTSELSRCDEFLGLDGNLEADPLFEDLEGRVLWRSAADGVGPPAGAEPWDSLRLPSVPDSVIELWRSWREEHSEG
jgi:hypothetical protein